MKLIVHNAPGFADFKATMIPGLGENPAVDSRGPLAVVSDESGELFVVPSSSVFTREGLAYAREWSAKTGRSVSQVYIPVALRPF